MTTTHTILRAERPDDNAWTVIGGGLHQYNVQQAGEPQGEQICFLLLAPDQSLVGGLIGKTHWGWFYINLLFIKEELRGKGYGHQLLNQAEEAARQSGATMAYLDTFSFQAPEFYKQHGYRVIGEMKDFPPGHTRFYMTKQL